MTADSASRPILGQLYVPGMVGLDITVHDAPELSLLAAAFVDSRAGGDDRHTHVLEVRR